jgi:hypothetical protein
MIKILLIIFIVLFIFHGLYVEKKLDEIAKNTAVIHTK